MIGTYQPHPEGGFVVQRADGLPPLRTAFDEERLRGMGYAPKPGLDPNATAGVTPPPRPNMATDAYTPMPGIQGRTPTEERAFRAWAPTPEAPPPQRQPPPTDAATAQASRDLFDRANAKAGAGAQARVERDPNAAKKQIRGGGDVRDDLPDAPERGGGGPTRQASYSPARIIKGGDVRAAFTVDKSGVNPEDWARFEQGEASALEQRKQAATDLAAQNDVRAGVESAEMEYRNNIEAADQIEAQRRADAMAKDYAARAKAIDDERNAINNLNTKPDKLFNGNDWGKALAAFSVLAGGLVQGLKGGKNPALEALNDIADRSAAEKRAEYDRRREGLAGKESDFARLVQIYGTPAAAESELRDRKRLLMQRWAEKRALDAGRVDTADQLKMQFSQWDQERIAGQLDRQQKLSDHVRESWQLTPDRVIGGGPKPDEKDVQALAKAREAAGIGEAEGQAGAVRDLIAALPEGELPTAESRNVASRAARGLVDWAAGAGTAERSFDTEAERSATAKLERAKAALLHKLSGAAISPTEMERLQRGLNELRSKQGLLRYNQELDRTIARRDAGVKAGFRPEVVETYEERQRARQPSSSSTNRRAE